MCTQAGDLDTLVHFALRIPVTCLLLHVVHFWKAMHGHVSYTTWSCMSSLKTSMGISNFWIFWNNTWVCISSYMTVCHDLKSCPESFYVILVSIRSFNHTYKPIQGISKSPKQFILLKIMSYNLYTYLIYDIIELSSQNT